MPLSKLGQVALPVADADRAAAYYGSVLGLPQLFRFGDLVFFDASTDDGTQIDLQEDIGAMAVVLNPDLLSVAEAARIAEALARLGILLSAVCLNRRDGADHPADLGPLLASRPLVETAHVAGPLRSRDDLLRLDLAPLAERLLAGPESTP